MYIAEIIKPIVTMKDNTAKEIAEAIAIIELEQAINKMLYS